MSDFVIWASMIGLGIFVFLFRAAFIVFWGHKEIPEIAQRHLRYVGVAIIPSMIAQLIANPANSDDTILMWLIPSIVAIAIGLKTRAAIWAMASGALLYIILKVAQSYGILF